MGGGGDVGVAQNIKRAHCAVLRPDHFKFASYGPVHPSNSIEVLQAQNQQLTETVHQLQPRIRELEEPKSTSLDTLLPSMIYSYSGAQSTEVSLSSTMGVHQGPS